MGRVGLHQRIRVLACAVLGVAVVCGARAENAVEPVRHAAEKVHSEWRQTELLRPPPEVRSRNGALDTALSIAYSAGKIGDDPTWLRNYNGGLVGPTLRVLPGDLMRIGMQNNLPKTEDSREMPGMSHHVMAPTMAGGAQPERARAYGRDDQQEPGWNEPHAFNVTNLHTHGLWVSPAGNSDNVLISIYPGQLFPNEIKIPAPHPPGTHWYHPHRHGSVAMQVSSGMAGMILIEGGLDDVPQIRAAAEQIMVLQQIAYDPDDCLFEGKDVRPAHQREIGAGCIESYKNMPPGHWPYLERPDGKPRFTTINGQVHPTVLMQPGQVQRWRLLHAGIRESISLALVRADPDGNLPNPIGQGDLRPLHAIAEDGIAYGFREEFLEFPLDPGNRVDVLVQLEQGKYFLVDLPDGAGSSLHANEESLKTLAFVTVGGSRMSMKLPSNADLSGLAPYPHVEDRELANEGSRCQKMQFDLVITPRMRNPNPPDNRYREDYLRNTEACQRANRAAHGNDDFPNACFFINGKAFWEERRPRQVRLRQAPLHSKPEAPGATADEWRFSSLFVNHPFHIHVNPFEVLNPPHHAGHEHPDGHGSVWRDTWLVRFKQTGEKGEFIRARTRYRRYIGAFVQHCHILDHEDQGMMEEVEVMPLPPEQQERYRCVD